jgi:hypothetical protein
MSDYRYFQQLHRSKTTDTDLGTGEAGKTDVITVRSADHQIWVQKITYAPTTAAAQAVTFQDDAGSPLVIAVVPASQATPITIDFGPKGTPLGVGKNLDISNTAGPGAHIHIEAYETLANAVAAASTN